MDFSFTEEQLMVRQTVRDFARKEIVPVSRQLDREGGLPSELLAKMAPLGYLGVPFAPEYGGMGISHLGYILFLEEMGRANLALCATVSVHMSTVGRTIEQWGTPEQKRKYLPRMSRGEILGCFCATEPNIGSDVSSIETTATRDGNGWVLNGTKIFATNGGVAGVALIVAQTDKSLGYRGITMFVVDRGTRGFTSREMHGKMGQRASSTGEIILEDCRVPADAVLGGQVGAGFKMAMSALDRARECAGAYCVGLAQACIDACIEYAKGRKQFGKPIGGHQLVQEMIADMIVETEAARLLTYQLASEVEKGKRVSVEASVVKYFASEAAMRVANKAVQVHGGYGYVDEFPVERYLRDIRVCAIWDGTSQIQQLIIGRDALGISAFT